MPLQGMGPQFDPVRVYHFTVRSAITSPYYSTRTFLHCPGVAQPDSADALGA